MRRGGLRAGRAGPGGGHLRPAAFSLSPRDDEEEDGEDAIILLLKKAKVRR